ncbi:hypothetical protein B0T16DRAFT_451049 [Cercophora newfieldiana]|uniref:Uncharacterized protein n=1 Tax=Cercophora newfieldiana TaxID=92897 RepID=A0AA39YMN1_9PEZI|nr:hypothetical protein B0T16DRAFT_451049 [Cercophora newfieldiana]
MIGGCRGHAKRGRPLRKRWRDLSSSREPTLERDTETDRAPAATFEEWPLGDTVLKRVTMDGSPPTFMVQFTWDQCAEHTASEEWPLGNAVLKRVTTDGSPPTFMVQFTWDPYAENGAEYCGTENRGHHREEAPSSETKEQQDHEAQGQTNFDFERVMGAL